MKCIHTCLTLLAVVGMACCGERAVVAAGDDVTGLVLTVPTLDLRLLMAQPAATEPKETGLLDPMKDVSKDMAQPTAGEASDVKKLPSFGVAGSNWFSVGVGYMHDFEEDQAGELHLGYSHFIADEVEFNVELTGWYFDQTGDNTGGVNPGFNFRWHFLHDEPYNWTVFAEAGIGLLFTFDEVPDGGTGFNFTPRAGMGFTTRIDDCGDRLQIGLRWQHISNGRIEGDSRNPGRDSLMGYIGIMFPF